MLAVCDRGATPKTRLAGSSINPVLLTAASTPGRGLRRVSTIGLQQSLGDVDEAVQVGHRTGRPPRVNPLEEQRLALI